MTTIMTADVWSVARHRLRDDVLGAGAVWAGFTIVVFSATFVVSRFLSIEVSGWEMAANIPRGFSGGLGVYLAVVYLPLYIAHGRTRRNVAGQLAVDGVVLTPVLAGLMTLGYAIERVIYTSMGWPHQLNQSHLFDHPTQYPLIFVEFLLLFAVWIAAGTFAGLAIYRRPANGLFAIPIVVAMIGAVEASLNPGFAEVVTAFAEPFTVTFGVSVLASTVVAFICLAVALPASWLLVRDLPLRNGDQ